MDEQQSKRNHIEMMRKVIELAMPDLRHYYRMTKKAKVVAVYASNGEYFVDVQPLRNDETPDPKEPIVPRVTLPVMWGGPDRGVVCPPTVGTLCDLSYYDGDPNAPYISNVRWGSGQKAPKAELNEFVIQLEPGVEIRIDKEKQIITLTPQNANTEIGKGWTVKAGETATIETKKALIKGAESVTIESPDIYQNGNVTTGGIGGNTGTVREKANRTQLGNLTINGNMSVNGDINCSGTSTAASRAGAPI